MNNVPEMISGIPYYLSIFYSILSPLMNGIRKLLIDIERKITNSKGLQWV